MKKLKILLITCILSQNIEAQQVPTISSPPNAGENSTEYWSRAGNLSSGNNLFGSKWNSPIYTVTGNNFNSQSYRMKVNGIFSSPGTQYAINNYSSGFNTTGYVLIGQNNNDMGGSNTIYSSKGAFSLLHLNGGGDQYQQFGYRPWMQTGITYTGNRDFAYFGLRQVGTKLDHTEAVFLWADNGAGEEDGPDNLVFRFSGFDGSDGNSVSTDRTSTTDLDGLHVATFNPTGYFGLGNTFGMNSAGMMAANYIRPQSLMHMSYDYRAGSNNLPYGFMQITYRRPDGQASNYIGQGETSDDGLRMGIDNTLNFTNGNYHLNGFLRWQENSPFIVQSDWDNTAGGVNSGERLRISSTGSPGVPATLENVANTTRVSIPYIGSLPIKQPKALLHIGYENITSAVSSWMDKGTLASSSTTSLYTGVLPANYVDANTAVIGFGGSDLSIKSANIDEVSRYNMTTGNLGVGNYGPTGLNSAPTEKIDVNGNGRFRNIPVQGGQSLILGLQQGANSSDVELSRLAFTNNPSDVLLGNGTWGPAVGLTGPAGPTGPAGAAGSAGTVFMNCTDPNAAMSFNSRFDLHGNNFYFEGNSGTNDMVGIGHSCGTNLQAKLDVVTNIGGFAGKFESYNGSNGSNLGVWGYSAGNGGSHIGVLGRTGATNTSFDAAIFGSPSQGPGSGAWGGYFTSDVFSSGNFIMSDSTLKHNIQPLESALELISKLEPKTYFMNQNNNVGMTFSDKLQYGFISQEIQKILPEAVRLIENPPVFDKDNNIIPYEGNGILSLNYTEFIPINTAAIKELDKKFEASREENEILKKENVDLNKRLTDLENCLSGVLPYLCQMSQSAIEANTPAAQDAIRKQLEVKLSNIESIVLDQNVPNPFAEKTIINFSIPASVLKAQLHFYNNEGRIIQSVDISERGLGSITVFGADLSRGIYTYSLVADGIVVATKKMMKN